MQCRLLPIRRRCLESSRRWAIARRQTPYAIRTFHASRFVNSPSPANPSDPTNPPQNNNVPNALEDKAAGHNNEPIEATAPSGSQFSAADTNTSTSTKSSPKEPRPYGSAARRAMRNRQPLERSEPVVALPGWLYERNLMLCGNAAGSPALDPDVVYEGGKQETSNPLPTPSSAGDAPSPSGDKPITSRYTLSFQVWDEVIKSVLANLCLPATKHANQLAATKTHLVLQYPGEGGIVFLNAVVKSLATDVGANLLTLNAQDIVELYSEQEAEESETPSSISSLSYEVFQSNDKGLEEATVEGGEEASGSVLEDESDAAPAKGIMPDAIIARPTLIPIVAGSPILQSLFGGRMPSKMTLSRDQREYNDEKEELRCLRLINELLSSPSKSPNRSAAGKIQTEVPSHLSEPPEALIVQIQDYKDIQSTSGGSLFLSLLHKAVRTRRREGQQIVIIGTDSRKPELSPARYLKLAQDSSDEFSRTIVVTPAMEPSQVDSTFKKDVKLRTTDVNVRHLQNMLKMRAGSSIKYDPQLLNDRPWPFEEKSEHDIFVKRSGLDKEYWSFDRVHRITTHILGTALTTKQFSMLEISAGLLEAPSSDTIKSKWMEEKYPKTKQSATESESEARLKLRKSCNSHEKKLLSGVVNADGIRTTFNDVHAPKDTVEALKTLTSLSLIRPDAFTYGVLATDKIPGLLLYGPPGTGKTLLAKAVARESGATVLEVTGSEVYDMYVGEGEKNVKAIFTLAKKLSPCVVFIDEADAIFRSRVSMGSRNSHRELINQFLREWDGMNDLSTFIMVATNRPFDLDDAVLRRLPRRLLVDLPTEQDRLSILKIHLKQEALDPTVDLADLASRTPLYSGSDLKNLCVAAALACVREENDAAAAHTGDEPYEHSKRRTLMPKHFEQAVDEISASISEDMSSLSAIKKFDEKYGDRKGRKKSSGWGFTPPGFEPGTTDTGRVRT
ncbi:hypothetical protein AJ80_02464 [Polytolypa hystricis UAMH7299]|uniref:AAA+ ATPase domain-containing protein n=1 Tax=Polytolypa hystricis (strain UAMH7299) TaxID=1447883 RepID=A0A2B7YQS0_POLH7|nr:hypothetical protein AJ80_02464 [Polytolypa hystricis UAMH7299]